MNIIRNIKQIHKNRACVLTIGNFDGVHLGHNKIIKKVQEIATVKNLDANILTFQPHPVAIFKPQNFKNFLITTLAQKLKIFKKYSLDNVFIISFNHDFADLSADDFVEKILVKKLQIKYLVIGYDFIFGKNREGNFDLLKKKSQEFDFEIFNIDALEKDGKAYSSSLIRLLIEERKVAKAAEILGRNFSVEACVVKGKKLANQIGFPTANIIAKTHIVKPKFGVYKSEIFIPFLNKKFKAITNFGIKPTIAHNSKPMFETHIFDFNQDIYGKKIIVELLDFMREERKFSSVEELKIQIVKDISAV